MSGNVRKRICLTLEEKLWIIKHKADNGQINQPKIALDFAAKFNRSISRQCVSSVLQNKTKILESTLADPELEVKKTRYRGRGPLNNGFCRRKFRSLLSGPPFCQITTHLLLKKFLCQNGIKYAKF